MRKDWLSYVVILIVSLFLVADLFFHPGRSITFDGHVHITTIAQFYNAIKDGEFPARWANGFANYGLPIPLVAHQTTSYLGALFQFFTGNAVLSYNLVVLTGVFLSSAFFYRFLRIYFSSEHALLAIILFHFAPYRIANIFIRGAIPEVFGTVFFPIVLIGLYKRIEEGKKSGLLWIALGTALLALTHPMMLVLSSLVIVPYSTYLLLPKIKNIRLIVKVLLSGILGILLASYYLVPLALEIKYFAYGTTTDHFRPEGGFLRFPEFFIDKWSYFGLAHPGPRENTLTIGFIEVVIIVIGALLLGITFYKKRKLNVDEKLVGVWLFVAVCCLFLMTTLSRPIYDHVFLFNNVQYPWRNLAPLSFVSPLIFCWLLTKTSNKYLGILVIIVVAVIRFPQLFGKNFMSYDLAQYDFTTANLHTNNMNTLWMGNSRDYSVKTKQFEIIQGNGVITDSNIKNASRRYTIHAEEPLRVVDYTFYFPGWTLLIDEQPTVIEFQDPDFRGVITYQVPAGDHTVKVSFQRTKIRKLGDTMSVIGVGIALSWVYYILRSQKISPSSIVRK